jgi:hypothetical protein
MDEDIEIVNKKYKDKLNKEINNLICNEIGN